MNKRLLSIALLLPLIMGMASCTKSGDKNRVKGSGDNEAHMITLYLVPQDVVLLPNNLSVLSNQMPRPKGSSLTLGWSGRELNPHREADAKEYMALAHEYGDLNYNRPNPTPVSHVALSRVVQSIDVIAKTDYDARHPAGASLNDIITVSYGSFMPFIKNGYQYQKEAQYDAEAEIYPRVKLSDFSNISLLRVRVQGNIGDNGSSRTSCLLEFAEKPTSPEQEMETIVTFSDGSQMRKSVRMTID